MHFLDLTLPTAAENLALDEALLLAAELGERGELGDQGEVLRLWEWERYAVVLGSSCRLAEDVDEAACVADDVPIFRRCSGGGTVLLGPGCLCFSLVLAFDRSPALNDVTHSYAYILERTARALHETVPGVARAGKSDLVIGDRKFSGNSQRRMRTHLLHHGAILYDFDLGRIGRYLKMPSRQPEYRRLRSHDHFLMNVPLAVGDVKSLLRTAWNSNRERADWPESAVASLSKEKYTREEWTRRR